MLLTGIPQFETQDDFGTGQGIPSISEWYSDPTSRPYYPPFLEALIIDEAVSNVFARLRNIFETAQRVPLSTTQLHDLTCFVIHRLLPADSNRAMSSGSSVTECMRYGIILYMLVIHGTTYYPHTFLSNQVLTRFEIQLAVLGTGPRTHDWLDLWLLTTGMAASTGSEYYQRLSARARVVATESRLHGWNDVSIHVKNVLWLETSQDEQLFGFHWNNI
jgi:hypothetical protein